MPCGFFRIVACIASLAWLVASPAAAAHVEAEAPDPCAAAAQAQAASVCAKRLGASWTWDYFGAATTRHAFRRLEPSSVLVQWQCHIDDGPVTTAVQPCKPKGGTLGSPTWILDGVESYSGKGSRAAVSVGSLFEPTVPSTAWSSADSRCGGPCSTSLAWILEPVTWST